MEISFDKLLKIVALMALSGQLATLANGASDYSIGNDIQGSISSSSSFLMDQMRRYFGAAMDPEPQSAFSNWQADDRIRKQRLLKDAVGKATDLIRSYQLNGLPNMPTLPSSIPGVGSVMRTPDKLFRAELSMLQDLIKMSQKMIQNPVMATVEIPKDFVEMSNRMLDQLEQ